MNRRTAIIAAVCLTVGAVSSAPVFAQQNFLDFSVQREQSNIYVRALPIEEVYVTRYGYRVLYRRSNGQMAYANMPLHWFGAAAGRGAIINSRSPAVPFMNVVFIDGEQSHVNLYLPPSRQHSVYRPVDRTRNWQEFFDGIETLDLTY